MKVCICKRRGENAQQNIAYCSLIYQIKHHVTEKSLFQCVLQDFNISMFLSFNFCRQKEENDIVTVCSVRFSALHEQVIKSIQYNIPSVSLGETLCLSKPLWCLSKGAGPCAHPGPLRGDVVIKLQALAASYETNDLRDKQSCHIHSYTSPLVKIFQEHKCTLSFSCFCNTT